jgi:glycosyltransferase involved in cell wall biosynthesis
MRDTESGICIVTQSHRCHTTNVHAHDLADILAEITQVSVLTANLPTDSRFPDEHEVVEFSSSGAGQTAPTEGLRFLWHQLLLCRAIYRREEQAVLFFGTIAYVIPGVFSRLLGKTVIMLPRGDVPLSLRLRWEKSMPVVLAKALAELVSWLEHVNYRLSDAIITYTPAMAEQLGLDIYSEKLHPNGARFVDTDQFTVRKSFENRDDVVGFIGRLDVEKRVPELAAAAKRLPDDIKFVFVGDGAYRELLEAELSEKIANGSAEIVGWVNREDVPEQLNRMRLQIVPSHPTEGLPTAILEGMACGTPAYATPVSGVPDVVRNGETGFLIDDVEGKQLAEGIERILARSDLIETSRKARTLVETTYSFNAAVSRWESILETI